MPAPPDCAALVLRATACVGPRQPSADPTAAEFRLTFSAISAMFGAEFSYGWKCAPGAEATRFFCVRANGTSELAHCASVPVVPFERAALSAFSLALTPVPLKRYGRPVR